MYRLIDEQPDFLVIDKAPGIAVHRDQTDAGLTMLLERDRGESLHLVHRLDRMTSGLMLFARNAKTAAQLGELFRARQVDKFYLALSDRKPSRKQGLVRGDMTRGRRGGWRLAKTLVNPAVTQFFSVSVGEGERLFLLRPLTGRTHQLRVALKSLGAPIIGDPAYHERSAAPETRGYLHAWMLGFELNGRRYRYRSDPQIGERFQTEALQSALEAWQDPWSLPWPRVPSAHTPASQDASQGNKAVKDDG
ncbi:RNA pseudouridine synthase [Marinobacterium nitratireducens]|uniref:RNA pseudouridine synthase n=1 Tax=Marinobacterium nitratireducens TaxID=518897 RepID=A0A918DY58_9GAMM|nr:TIGR01621 family pseudouridine synthase [Marinobacterium nitratireducens]GGO87600.1 RNA pseudouridine synthase [Marinobacterium nitratireducens]